MQNLKKIRAGVLEIAYVESGPVEGPPVFLMHGFPSIFMPTAKWLLYSPEQAVGLSCHIYVVTVRPDF